MAMAWLSGLLTRNNVAGKPQMDADEHRFGGKVSFAIAQSASPKGDAPRVHSRARFLAFYLCPSVLSRKILFYCANILAKPPPHRGRKVWQGNDCQRNL